MSVIVEVTLPAGEFELGRVLDLEGNAGITLEMVPLGERPIPFFRLREGRKRFEETVRNRANVNDIHAVDTTGEETLYALDWRISDDAFFAGVLAMDGRVLEAFRDRPGVDVPPPVSLARGALGVPGVLRGQRHPGHRPADLQHHEAERRGLVRADGLPA